MTDTHVRADNRSSQDIGDKLQQAGQTAKQTASDALSATSEMAHEKFDALGTAAKDAAAKTTDKIKEQVGEQQHAGADYVHRLADNLRNAAQAFDQDAPFASQAISKAASYVDDYAEKMRHGSLSDLTDGVTSFARRQPAAFLGLSLLAGVVVVRFLKASAGGTTSSLPARNSDGSFRSYPAGYGKGTAQARARPTSPTSA